MNLFLINYAANKKNNEFKDFINFYDNINFIILNYFSLSFSIIYENLYNIKILFYMIKLFIYYSPI